MSFIDGGVGRVQISSQVPILLRVMAYRVKVGDALAERQPFGYYPVVLGDLQGGSKDRKDFVDIVRITAELLGGLSALTRTPELRALMLTGRWCTWSATTRGTHRSPRADIDLFLRTFARGRQGPQGRIPPGGSPLDLSPDGPRSVGRLGGPPRVRTAGLDLLPIPQVHPGGEKRTSPRHRTAWSSAAGTVGVFGTGAPERCFRGLRAKGNQEHFNRVFGRTDLNSQRQSWTGRLHGTLLLAMILRPGQRTEAWSIAKYERLRKGRGRLPGRVV